VRRAAILVPIVVLAGALLAWRRRHTRAARAPLDRPPSPAPPVALLEPGARFVSVPWTLLAAPEDRPELTIRCAGDERMELDRVDAQETPTQVFVTVLMRRERSSGGSPAGRRTLEAAVALSRPLGARELVHAPVDVAASDDEPSGPPLYP
jgi:hypothetical protein